ncbi:MAG: cbb3-type cytochrome c oxidase subunit I [Bacteroidota bacterium]|nr:cbb3-type cytochrome c oxidase subunit I [Bacteroidota bacterium]
MKKSILLLSALTTPWLLTASETKNILTIRSETFLLPGLIALVILPLMVVIALLYNRNQKTIAMARESSGMAKITPMKKSLKKGWKFFSAFIAIFLTAGVVPLMAQATEKIQKPLLNQPGILITIVLVMIPVLLGAVFALVKANNAVKIFQNRNKRKEAEQLAENLKANGDKAFLAEMRKEQSGQYSLRHDELSGEEHPYDERGLVQNVSNELEVHFTAVKKKATPRPSLSPDITKLILWYLGCSVFWLVLGSSIGEYVGIKFVAPEIDTTSWLSFGRLRPVHTNMVFWGWASLGIIGLGYYVVPTVSNTKIFKISWGWTALVLINAMVALGTLSLMAGINNGGGEFREYIWPIMALFAVALILTLINFLMTVARRTSKEIYISNWYIISSIIFTIIIALTAYLPFWQNGLGETIIQGYYMHSGVGMWFTLFTLGLLYYFIPQQLNRPIYAYSLGILAFWTQILFYTIIGTHHFVFSAIPWWLQTVAIVGSAGMIIPVVAGTINFTMTFRGQWGKVANSYTLPFFLVAVVYYFIISMQGTAQAFRATNLLWHFTDFTVGHSHLGFYGIITFAIWGGAYAIVPRLTGKEPPQHMVGAHFWLAFVGLLLYAVPLSIGATLKGVMWMDQKPFIDSVVMMFDYWVWRAIGGSLMFLSHLFFAYNFFRMVHQEVEDVDVKKEAYKILTTENQMN